MQLWQSVLLEESEWDVNQHLFLPADYEFKYCIQKKKVLVRTYAFLSFKCFNLNDDPREIYKLIITVINYQFLYIISTSADSDYVKPVIYNLDDMTHCHFLNITLSLINFHLHIKCKLHSFNGSSTICIKLSPKGRFYMTDVLVFNIF
jgi:hypothetical protein